MRTCGHSTPLDLLFSTFTAILISCGISNASNEPPLAVLLTQLRRTRSPSAGGCDFGTGADPNATRWTALALPSVIVLTQLPPNLADLRFHLQASSLDPALTGEGGDHLIERRGALLRVHVENAGADPPAVLLPFDRLFEVRMAAVLRLWRALNGRAPGPNPAALSEARRNRLILALRALDGRLDGATNRQIAGALFGADAILGRDWISHELRDRTARLVRLGVALMNGGYRRLLLHPYRGRI
jgi:Uncharacterized conserved protein (DUF2285)